MSAGMTLGTLHRMRFPVVALVTALLAGCPSAQHPNQDIGDAGVDAAGDAGAACTAIPTCTTTIQYHGTGTTVTLYGDFAADGWTTGVPMTNTNRL